MISLKEGVKFHGHLGPYLVLGILAGDLALERLGAKKYFGLKVKVRGATKKPKSCFLDGLQLSTGATFGKGNIEKKESGQVRILFCNLENNKKLNISLKESLMQKLDGLKGHHDSEVFAKILYKTNPLKLFNLV